MEATTRPSFAEFNNAAIECVERGALSEAARLFQMALHGARDHSLLLQTERRSSDPFLLEFYRETQLSMGGVMYTKPIAIVRSPARTTRVVPGVFIVSDLVIVSAAIVFNLAIVYHIRSGGQDLVSSTNNTHSTRTRRHNNLLVKTRSLYEKTQELLQHAVVVAHDHCSSRCILEHYNSTVIVDLIHMAVMNNLARIHMSSDHEGITTSQEGLACLGQLIRHSSRLLDSSLTAVSNNVDASNRSYDDCSVALWLREQASWLLSNALLTLSSCVLDRTIIKGAPAA